MSHQQQPIRSGVDVSSFDEQASPAASMHWLSLQLNRTPEARDLYAVGRALYESGRFRGAAKMLQLYADGEGCESPGLHLLAHAYMMCEEKRKAILQAKRVVNCQTHSLTEQRLFV
jgi:hypothetical protein